MIYNLGVRTSTRKYSQLFLSLTNMIEALILEAKKHSLQDKATEEWTVKEVFCHITFWHTYYAENYSSLAAGAKPFIFSSKSGSTRNQDGVNSLKHKSLKDLERLLLKAQESLYKSIVIKEVPKMNYTDRREYTTKDFLEMIIRHIQRHIMQIRLAKRRS